MGKCFIIGAGDMHSCFVPSEKDLVIAADGGYDALLSNGVAPDIVIGDLDSIRARIPEGSTVIRYPKEKDETDTFLAYSEGVKRGYRDFHIYGGTGGREDHTYANLSLLLYARRHGHRATLYGNDTLSFVIKDESVKLGAPYGANLSLFSVSESSVLTVKGAKYETESTVIRNDFPLGVSNSFKDTSVTVEVSCGEVLVVMQSGDAPEYLN